MEVIECPGQTQIQIYQNAFNYLKDLKVMDSPKSFLQTDTTNFTVKNRGSFYVHNHGSMKKHPDGAVEYNIIIECRDQRYRYTITNFIFNPYKRNRYGKFEPVSGKYTPLETEPSGLNRSNWNNYRLITFNKSQDLITDLKKAFIASEISEPGKVIKHDTW